MTSLKKVTLISNGHGEDLIGLNILKAIQKKEPHTQILAVPLVGKGHIYENAEISTLFKNPNFPSEGFIRTLKDLFKDIKSGLIKHIRFQRKQLKNYPFIPETIFAVGDIYALWMAQTLRKKNQPIIFLPTAKSNKFMPHTYIEKKLMKRWATQIYTRDIETKKDLYNSNLPAYYRGNPMMDNLQPTGKTFNLVSTEPIIGLLPGSREEAYLNLEYLYKLISNIRKTSPNIQILIAKSPVLEKQKFKTLFPPDNKTIHSSKFTDILHSSHLIIGLSGTANEQAIEVGKTVLSFPGFGPQSSPKRFKEQQKLLGKKLLFHPNNNIQDLSKKISSLLKNTKLKFSYKQKDSAAQSIINSIIIKNE